MMELHARWKVAFKYLFGKQKKPILKLYNFLEEVPTLEELALLKWLLFS